MADSYLTISIIAKDADMLARVTACAAQQHVYDPQMWAIQKCYEWAASPSWAEKWDYAVATGVEEPGKDSAVITDGDILAEVQALIAVPTPIG